MQSQEVGNALAAGPLFQISRKIRCLSLVHQMLQGGVPVSPVCTQVSHTHWSRRIVTWSLSFLISVYDWLGHMPRKIVKRLVPHRFRGGSRGGSELLPMRLDALFAEKKGAEPPAATLLRTVQGDWPTEQLPTERRIGNRSIPIFECCFGIAQAACGRIPSGLMMWWLGEQSKEVVKRASEAGRQLWRVVGKRSGLSGCFQRFNWSFQGGARLC